MLPMKLRSAFDVKSIINLSRVIRKGSFDVIHTHGCEAGIGGRIAARMAGVGKVVHTMHSACLQSSGPGGILHRYIDSRLSHWTDMIIAGSGQHRRLLIKSGVPTAKVSAIRPGVDLNNIYSDITRSQARKMLTVPTGSRVIGTISGIGKQDKLDDLVQASAMLSRIMPDLFLVIVGEGEDSYRLRSLARGLGISHRILFSNCYHNPHDVLSAFDLFIMASLSDERQQTILEAMAAGLPVIAADIPGTNEIIVDGFTGYIVPSNPKAIAEAAVRAFEYDRIRTMGMAGRQRVESLFGLDRMAEQIERIYMGRPEPKTSRVTAGAMR